MTRYQTDFKPKHMTYTKNLQKLKLAFLDYRRTRGDMVEISHIQNIYNEDETEVTQQCFLPQKGSPDHKKKYEYSQLKIEK